MLKTRVYLSISIEWHFSIERYAWCVTVRYVMYNKIFTKILDSSIWLETNPTRIVWMTFLASMDETGYAHFAALGNLAARARVTLEEAAAAVAVLEAPDKESSDPANDGRRIERIPGGWMVLNAEKYRLLVTRAVIQEQTRLRVARYREKNRGNAPVTVSNEPVTPSEALAEAGSGKTVGAKAPQLSDEEWRKSLASNPAYQGIDIEAEFGKMSAWCEVKRKKPSRARFVNWLNRAERPMDGPKPKVSKEAIDAEQARLEAMVKAQPDPFARFKS